jgi:branched-chain amino acid transport system ATP-binding protein
MGTGTEEFLKIEHLNVVYGKVIHALKDVSLDVAKGEIVAILGANGAGKTSLLRTISGLVKPTQGSIRFNGQETTGMPAFKVVRLGIAHVPEGRMIVPHFTIKENLLAGGYIVKDKAQLNYRIDSMLGEFPILKARLNSAAGTLSGGEQQMLAIGRALISQPSLLLLDEPSLGLAPIMVDKVMEMVRLIRDTHKTTIVLVEQDAFVALETADRAYVLENGKITMSGDSHYLAHNEELKAKYLAG